MNDYILLGISSDTIVGLEVGSFEDLSVLKEKYSSVADATGIRLKIEGVNSEGIASLDTNKITELYKYLLDVDND